MNTFRDREAADRRRMGLALKALRTRLGLSQGAAAENAGFSSYKAWQNYENGERKFTDPKLQTLLLALNADREEFDLQLARIPEEEPRPPQPRSFDERGRPYALPFSGLAHGGALRPNVAHEEEAEVIDLSRFFAAGTRILRLDGMSMYPYAEPGGFVTYNPKQPARRGHGCVVELKDGSKLVKRFEHYDDQSLVVTELWPEERQITIALEDVAGVYAIGLRGD
jgi:phage repressor protein C with HTH and peptisase S24 domain